MSETDDVLLERTETWFVRRGLPYFIEDRTATDDVFTRGLPLLLVYFVVNLLVVLSSRLQAVTVPERVEAGALGVLVLSLLYGVRNVLRRERFFSLPNRISWMEIAAFILIPPVVDYASKHQLQNALIDLGGDVGIVLGIYILTSAFFPLVRWALKRLFQELEEVFNLAARALPLLFLFNSFLFISGDVWEFAGGENMTRTRLWGVVGLFAGFTVMFLLYRLPDEVRKVAAHDDRSTVVEACKGTPMETVSERVILHEGALPLTRGQRLNVLMVLFVGQFLQVLLLGVLVFVFFICFGKAAISTSLINDWTHSPKDIPHPAIVFGHALSNYIGISIDDRLWQVSLFLAGVSAFFFAVSSLTDETYKAQFYQQMNMDLETAIQVRRVYLALYEGRHSVEAELSPSGFHMMHVPTPMHELRELREKYELHEEHEEARSHRHARSD